MSVTVEKLAPSVTAAADRYNDTLKSLREAEDKRISSLASWLPYVDVKPILEVACDKKTQAPAGQTGSQGAKTGKVVLKK